MSDTSSPLLKALDAGSIASGRARLLALRSELPAAFPLRVWCVAWAHFLAQAVVFGVCLWQVLEATALFEQVLWALPLGWAWFALLMVGHDAAHRAFSPWRSVDRVIAFLTLDCLLVSERRWREGHQALHHARPLCDGDMMHLRGETVLAETAHLARMVVIYLADDVRQLVLHPTMRDVAGAAVRYSLLATLLPLALWPMLLSLIVCGNYLGLLAHVRPAPHPGADPVLKQLRTSWDLFPESPWIAGFLTGGLNAHATHHVFAHLPRGAQPLGARLLKRAMGTEYRSIETMADLVMLFRARRDGVVRTPAVYIAGRLE